MRSLIPILAACMACPATATRPDLPPDEERPPETAELPGYLSADFQDVPSHVPREGSPSAAAAPVFPTTRGRILDVEFSPDGNAIAFSTSDKVIGIVDVGTGHLRAYRRVRVRADESIRLVGFDGTGTRLLFLTFGYSESNVYAWDLWTNRFRVIEQEQVEGFGTVAFGGEALVHSGYESNTVRLIKPDAETQRLDLEHEVQRMVSAADRKTVLLETQDYVAFLDTTAGAIVAHVEGAVGAVRPGGGLIAIVQDEGSRITDERGEVIALLRDTRVGFTSRGELILDRAGEGPTQREIIDPRSRETLAELSIPNLDLRRHQDDGRVSHAIEDDGRAVVRYDLATGEPTELFAGWERGGEETMDEDGEYLVVNAFEFSPDRSTLAVAFGTQLRILDAATGEERAQYANGSGESSVWEVEDLESGLGVWGRGWAQIWSAAGLSQIRCPGSEGGAVLVRNQPAVRSNYQACWGDARYTPEDENANLLLGTHGERFVERSGNQLLLRDFTNGRTRARYRLPDDLEVYCEGGGCSATYHPASARSAWLLDNLESKAWLIGSGRARDVGEAGWGSRPVGNRLYATVEGGAKLYDTRGRQVASLEGELVAIDPDGTQWISRRGENLVVVNVADGEERARVAAPGDWVRLELFGDAIVAHEEGSFTLHNTRGAAAIPFPHRTPIAVFPDGSHFVVCESGSLSLRRIEGEVRRELGACGLGEQLFLIDPATDASGEVSGMVALDSVTVVSVFPLAGGAPLTLRTNGGNAVATMDGKFWAQDDVRASLRWRAAGSLLTAALGAAEPHYDATLLSRFFR